MALQSFNLLPKFQYNIMLNMFNFNPVINFYSATSRCIEVSTYGTPAIITQETCPNPYPKEMFQVIITILCKIS